MNAAGAVIFDTKTGDPVQVAGWTTNAAQPQEVTVRGNYTKGFRVYVGDRIQTRAYADPAVAHIMADHYAGVLERAN